MGKFKPTRENRLGRIARHAADILDERGWIQGREEDRDTGQVCLLGATLRAVAPMGHLRGQQVASDLSYTFGKWMLEHHGEEAPSHFILMGASMPAWNDGVFKTKEETVGWLRKFADDLDPQRV